ncbi:hypothetical protein BGW36DRAFT_357621 [Talaromyces proteolyticus]|uniref:Xylanolytic transcriptional activator regulatory domain-containing protein n=1 Tax=Talaromyces proteolyticus TaxID=1131652 RepID=A0AAD4Q334_9EURO|nr:uncharacterized protein BGW36DRAFT_357621 [Talaromyces proteolyticus]KAH8700988.1 hypothetical protein BGW36DRAFT_357621 [Talaromyces proteolyticus]
MFLFKGNQQRPTCSRCQEAGIACIYSSKRRKPGPPKGVRRKRRSPQTGTDIPTDPTQLMEELNSSIFPGHDVNSAATNIYFPSESGFPDTETFLGLNFSNTHSMRGTQLLNTSGTESGSHELPFTPTEELDLLNNFFAYFHPSGFLFQKNKFLAKYHNGLLDRSLINTILVITLLTLRPRTTTDHINLEDLLDKLRNSCSYAIETSSGFLTLDVFRQACMLAFFDFHQRPGLQSWMKVGQLTRHAYRQGLNQIENPDTCAIYQFPHTIAEDIEEWRRAWWFIYTLDSYSNIMASTPFLIELDGVHTALIGQESESTSDEGLEKSERAFLASEPDQLWKTMQTIVANGNELNANIHLITTTILRMAAKLSLLRKQNPSEDLFRRIESLKGHISAVRLAMPLRYMKPTRDVIINETKERHHERLVCILHIHAALLMLSIPPYPHKDEDAWLLAWRQTLEPCDDIVSVLKEWDVFASLVVIWLLGKYGFENDVEVRERMGRASDILTLFLDHFEPLCCQPRVLKMWFQKFKVQYPGSFGSKQISQILRSINVPFQLNASHPLMQQDHLGAGSTPPPLNPFGEQSLTSLNLLSPSFDIDDLQLII